MNSAEDAVYRFLVWMEKELDANRAVNWQQLENFGWKDEWNFSDALGGLWQKGLVKLKQADLIMPDEIARKKNEKMS